MTIKGLIFVQAGGSVVNSTGGPGGVNNSGSRNIGTAGGATVASSGLYSTSGDYTTGSGSATPRSRLSRPTSIMPLINSSLGSSF